MADQELVRLLDRGVETWNAWRRSQVKLFPGTREAIAEVADLVLRSLVEAKPPDPLLDLTGVDLSGRDLRDIDLGRCDLSNANLADTHLERSSLGPVLCGANLCRARLDHADLVGTDLRGAQLADAIFEFTRLRTADLRDTDLSGLYMVGSAFDGAQLSGASLAGANLTGADFLQADLRRCNLRGAILDFARLWRSKLDGADLSGCRVHGTAVWDVSLEQAIQTDLIVTFRDQPIVLCDDLEVGQFLYLLLDGRNLRKVFHTIASRGVLLLGRFRDGGRELLAAIADALRERDYLPMIFDFDPVPGRNLTEMVTVMAGLSRFVIVELTGASVPQELAAVVPRFHIPFVPVLAADRQAHSMFSDFGADAHVLTTVRYRDAEDLARRLEDEIIAPAERYISDRERRLQKALSSI